MYVVAVLFIGIFLNLFINVLQYKYSLKAIKLITVSEKRNKLYSSVKPYLSNLIIASVTGLMG